MNHFGWLLISLVPFFLHAFAAPLHPRATLTCTDADVSQIAGLTIDARSRLLEINPISGTADPTPIFAAALSLTNAKNVTDQLGTSLLFATAPPPPDNAVALILGSLQDAQKSMASIVPNDVFANNTGSLTLANGLLTNAISEVQSLNCTTV